jgi:hypothetical protein
MPGYNLLRHAACVWALNQASAVDAFVANHNQSRRQALTWLLNANLSQSPQSGLCMVEGGKVKLGANALAILAIISSAENRSREQELLLRNERDVVEKLCDHMLAQITPDGDFHHEVDAATGALYPFRSDYYTGEALFALLATLRRYPEMRKLQVAQDLLYALTESDYGVSQHSHWMMYATDIAHVLAPSIALLAYGKRMAERILDSPAYRTHRRCTPIACRSEALLAYLRIARRAGLSTSPIFAQIQLEVKTNLLLQLMDRLPHGAFREGAGSAVVRIDYLQHNLSSFLGYSEFEV